MTVIHPTRALVSVSDKTGLIPFARALADEGVELISTGGTAAALVDAGLGVIDVATLTGVAEMLGGRVKTLHPAVHGGILADLTNPEHRAAIDAHGITPIGLVVCNLYPFEAALSAGRDAAELVETIDVGGPTMVRAAAKNHHSVTVVVDPDDYAVVGSAVAAGGVPLALRRRLAAKAFARLAAYDAVIAAWLLKETVSDGTAVDAHVWHALGGRRVAALRYGENPHQSAAFYRSAGGGLADATLVQGKALSYNNLADADAALSAVADFADKPAVVIVKHANPCGIALGASLVDAYEKARACDPVSAFGGVVAVNRLLDEPAARVISEIFTEVVVAPSATDGAKALFAAKPNLRLILAHMPERASMVRTVAGGFLVQDADHGATGHWRVVSARAPTEAEAADLRFAEQVAKHVKSNAIVYAKGEATVGIGAGQMSRVDAARIGAWKAADAARDVGQAEPRTRGAVAASDAFFPFADALETIAKTGVTAVISPGGSRRDEEVIAAADARGLALVFTGVRHFRH